MSEKNLQTLSQAIVSANNLQELPTVLSRYNIRLDKTFQDQLASLEPDVFMKIHLLFQTTGPGDRSVPAAGTL